MVSRPSGTELPPSAVSTKIIIAGGFGAGKTTFVRSISEIEPVTTQALMTEALMTGASRESGGPPATPEKLTTTVAMDFGRVRLDAELALYLFGTPGQDRFWFLWDDLIRGALGAVVLADPRRLADCFPAIEYFENSPAAPFIVTLNCFNGILPFELDDVRSALAIGPDVPLLTCDARDTVSAVGTLTELVRYAMNFTGPPTLM